MTPDDKGTYTARLTREDITMNFELIAYRPVSGHPDDYYLSIVLRKMPNKIHPYVTHLHNENDNGYSAGHYFEHLGEALTDFCTR